MARSGRSHHLCAPWGLLGMLALVWVIEGFVSRSPWTGSLGWSWRSSREVVDGVRDCRVLLFGDSQVKVGIQGDLLQRQLGEPVYNLAVLRAHPAASAMLLRRALDAGARPEAVILDAFPGILTDHPRMNGAEWAELLDTRGWFELLRDTPDPQLVARAMGHWLIPSVDARWSIRPVIAAALAGQPDPSRLLVERRERLLRRGSIAVRASGLPLQEALPDLPAGAGKKSGWWRVRPENLNALRRFCTLAKTHDIHVYWLWPTQSPDTQARRETLRLDEPFEVMVRRLQDEFPNLTVLDVRRAGLEATDFYDPGHLNDQGAEALTNAVALALTTDRKEEGERVPSGDRWLALRVRPAAAVALRPDSLRRE